MTKSIHLTLSLMLSGTYASVSALRYKSSATHSLPLQSMVKPSQQGYKRWKKRETYDSDDIITSLLRFLQGKHLLLRSSSRKHDLGIFSEDGIPIVYRKLLHVVASQKNRFDGIIVSGLHLSSFAHRRKRHPRKAMDSIL